MKSVLKAIIKKIPLINRIINNLLRAKDKMLFPGSKKYWENDIVAVELLERVHTENVQYSKLML